VGSAVVVKVIRVDKERHRLGLTLKDVPQDVDVSKLPLNPEQEEEPAEQEGAAPRELPEVGALVTGRVSLGPKMRKLNPPSVVVVLPNRLYARVCITELEDPDGWADNAVTYTDAGPKGEPPSIPLQQSPQHDLLTHVRSASWTRLTDLMIASCLRSGGPGGRAGGGVPDPVH
jgi:hypothetical protein